MSVYDLLFCFGKPGTYLLYQNKQYLTENVPVSMYKELQKHPNQRMTCCALDSDNNYFMSWAGETGDRTGYTKWRLCTLSELRTLVDDRCYACRTAFGASFGQYLFYCCGMCTQSLAERSHDLPLPDTNNNNNNNQRLALATYGVANDRIFVHSDGTATWNIRDNYPDLERILRGIGQGDLVFASLNRYRKNEFFLALADGRIFIRASALTHAHQAKIQEWFPNVNIMDTEIDVQGDSYTLPPSYIDPCSGASEKAAWKDPSQKGSLVLLEDAVPFRVPPRKKGLWAKLFCRS